MPSTLPSFASAAAASGRQQSGDNVEYHEWTRRPNGTTQTFRRSSQAAPAPHQRDSSSVTAPPMPNSTQTSGTYVPPHLNAVRNGTASGQRYSKGQLLDLFREQKDEESMSDGLSHLFVGDTDPPHANGSSSNRWNGRREDAAPSLDACWDQGGGMEPLGLVDLTEEENQLFSTSVNSPLKAPNSNTPGAGRDAQNLRKLSISQAAGVSGAGLSSPTTTRPGTRRRDTGEFQTSSINTRLSQEEEANTASPSLVRRRTDLRLGTHTSVAEEPERTALKRTTTGGLSSTPASPWGPAPPSAGSVFGAFAFGGAGNGEKWTNVSRGEGRFRNLMTRDSSDDVRGGGAQPSLSGLGMVGNSIQATKEHENESIGSAALGGDSPLQAHGHPDYGTPQRRGFGEAPSLPRLGQQRSSSNFGASSQLTQKGSQGDEAEEANSPTFTNPYQSPEQRTSRLEGIVEPEEPDLQNLHLPGLGGFGPGSFGRDTGSGQHLGSGVGFGQAAFERETGAPSRGFPGLGTLGTLGGLGGPSQWPSNSSATTGRERPGLYDLGPQREPQSPSVHGFGSTHTYGPFGSGGLGTIGRGGSRLGSLFPSQMQDQMRLGRDNTSETTDKTDEREIQGPTIGLPLVSRDTNSPLNRVSQEEGVNDPHAGAFGDPQSQSYSPGLPQIPMHATLGQQQHGQQRMGPGLSSQPPAAQQKTMVMPDRIRWIYRDPQGNTQGPWSGLEMHDWYRAGFFSPELLVKKVEDPDFEPLAQLIRRIGNSREPFLVPQIGIPGPPTGAASGWPNQSAPPNPASTQPPFASSFPSFGTTLTAEQQNALERRKQEEQYLMARQKEHLAQQQLIAKQMQITSPHSMFNQQLQPRSSAQSLNSQPSYGSITSPAGYQPPAMTNASQHMQPPHYENTSLRMGSAFGGIGPIGSPSEALDDIKEEQLSGLMNRLSTGSGHGAYSSIQGRDQTSKTLQRAELAAADRALLEDEQAAAGGHNDMDFLDSQARLRQFHDLQSDLGKNPDALDALTGEQQQQQQQQKAPRDDAKLRGDIMSTYASGAMETKQKASEDHGLSLTEQVQKAASAKQSPMAVAQTRVDAPAPSTSPLPAPAARRSRGNVADNLAAESSASASPSVETPTASLAPWAKETSTTEALKGPSLKEIQEAEARRAAKQEEVAAAQRRAALERELAAQPIAPAPGLPASSTWGNIETGPASSSAWAKAAAAKTPTGSMNKKTLQQIQKEEEALARRQKAVAVAALASQVTTATAPSAAQSAAGKRYADLAGKAASPAPSIGSGAWTTVGSSGKLKPPAAPPALVRSTSGKIVNPSGTRPNPTVVQSRSTPVQSAKEEFKRWAIVELRPELNKGLQAESVFDDLLNLPPETDFITEAVYQLSASIDSRHFAEEFVRRRGLAEKGKTVPLSGSNPSSHHGNDNKGNGGWSEVARKGPAPPQREDSNSFKIVPAKKKTGKK